jgi:hypothetical protein
MTYVQKATPVDYVRLVIYLIINNLMKPIPNQANSNAGLAIKFNIIY